MGKFIVFPDKEPVTIDVADISFIDSSLVRESDGQLEYTISLKSGKDVVIYALIEYMYKFEDIMSAISKAHSKGAGSFTYVRQVKR